MSAPYRKPGIPLTKAIRDAVGDRRVDVVVLENHGVIILGDSVDEVAALISDVEKRLELPECGTSDSPVEPPDVEGWDFVPEVAFLALDETARRRVVSGTYYPDHVVFLGPGLPVQSLDQFAGRGVDEFPFPATVVEDVGVFIKSDATTSQRAMLNCVADVLSRLPDDWALCPIGQAAEEELLNWDAEKYRQMLASRES